MGTAIALLSIVQLEADPFRQPYYYGELATFGPFASPMVVVYVAWFAALVTAITGFTRTARLVALATIPLTVAARLIADESGMWMRPTWTFLGLMVLLAAVVAAGNPAPHRRGVVWGVAWLAASMAAFLIPQFTSPGGSAFQDPSWLDRPLVVSWSPVLALALALILALARLRAWSGAVLLLGIPWTAVAVFGSKGAPADVALLAVGVVVAMAVPVVVLRVFGFRVRVVRA